MVEELSIGVVANTDDAHEIRALLEQEGLPVAWVGDGADATLSQFSQRPPAVVVLCAHLERGDARALVSAMRGTDHPVGIVLVGEEHGPVRNALDALDFDIDRFVGRPLSAKAMTFAVRMAGNGATPTAAPRQAPQFEDRLEAYTDTAIEAFLQDAVDGLEEAGDLLAVLSDAAPAPEVEPMPEREETLILSDGGVAAAQAAQQTAQAVGRPDKVAVPEPVMAEETEQQHEPPLFDAGSAELGELGRSLREKMSQMAERLFPGRTDAAEALGGGVATDAHSEIDLAALGSETLVGRDEASVGSFADIGGADTFTEAAEASDGGSNPALLGEIEVGDDTTGLREQAGGAARARRPTAPPAMRGELSVELDVASLLSQLFRDGLTGQVVLRRGREEKVLHLDEGRPVFATSNLPHDRMGDLLYREGKITRDQHAMSRALVAESGRRMGEILVEHGFLKRRELLPAVRRHLEDIIYSLFAWETGEYSTLPGECAPGEKIRLSRHPAALIVEGIRRKYGFDMLEHRVGGAGAAVALIDDTASKQLLSELDLAPLERRVLERFSGDSSLAEIAQSLEIDLLTAFQLAFGLLVLGIAEVSGGAPGTGPSATGSGLWEQNGRSPALVGATEIAIDRQRLLAKHAHVTEADYFMLLGVRRDASTFEIQRAYETARRDYAADAFPPEVREQLSREIVEINAMLQEAYDVLSDARLREAYRNNLRD